MTRARSATPRIAAKVVATSRLAEARASAATLARRLQLTLPVAVDEVAAKLGAEVVIGPLPDALAQLTRWKDRARIRLSDAVAHPGAQRFSLAHEIGHLWLDHRGVALTSCTATATDRGVSRGIEAEANTFASELLLPEHLLTAWPARVPDLDAARDLAAAGAVSLTAASRRLCEISEHPCAVVRVRAGRIDWAVRSSTFPGFLPRGRLPGPDSAVTDWIAYGRIPHAPRVLPAMTWCGVQVPRDLLASEQLTTLPGSRDVLALLWIDPRDTSPATNRDNATR